MRGSLWRDGDFLKLWTGETVSVLGTQITGLAMPTLAVLDFRANALQVGILVAAGRLPFPVLGLVAGGLIDRLPRRPVMIVASIARAFTIGAVPALAVMGHLQLWELYLVAVATGAFTVLFDVAYLAFLPGLVGHRSILEASSKIELGSSIGLLVGPGLAGLLIQWVGAARTIGLDAASYVFSALAALFVRRAEARAAPKTSRGLGIGSGLRFVTGHPILMSLLLTSGALIVGGHVVEAVEVPFAYRSLELRPQVFGAVLMVAGAGAITGSVLAVPVTKLAGVGRTIPGANIVAGLALTAIPLALVLPPLPVLVCAFLVIGIADTIANVAQRSLRQILTPDAIQGRMSGTFRTVYWTAWPLGNVLGGLAGLKFGLTATMIGGGALAVAAGAAMLLTPIRRLVGAAQPLYGDAGSASTAAGLQP